MIAPKTIEALLSDPFDPASNTLEEAKVLLAHANDATIKMEDRVKAYNRADAIRIELSFGRSKVGVWPTLSGVAPSTTPAASSKPAAPANGGKPVSSTTSGKSTKVADKPKGPLIAGVVYVADALQQHLFYNVLLPNITEPGGRWTDSKPHGHADAVKIAKCVVAPHNIGITFGPDATKRNYNLNDSTWLKPDVLNPILKDASAAIGRPIEKKEMVLALEALKKTLGKDAPRIAEPEVSEDSTDGKVNEPIAETIVETPIEGSSDALEEGEKINEAGAVVSENVETTSEVERPEVVGQEDESKIEETEKVDA